VETPVKLKDLIAQSRCTLAPGVYDCLSAKIAEAAGFEAIEISGYSVEASMFGLPDLGFAGLSDLADVAERIAGAVSIPVICDADTGYGGTANVRQTVRRLERTGVAAIHIEDQADPKKCGGLPGRNVISTQAMCDKVKAALDARTSGDFLIIARTDAKGTNGIADAIDRLNTYREAGADAVFAAERYSREELVRLGREVKGPLAICGGIPGWPGSFASAEEFGAMGIRLVMYALASLYLAARAMQDTYREVHKAQNLTPELASRTMCSFDDFNRLVDVAGWTKS
jgi:methylisocitrate lyase